VLDFRARPHRKQLLIAEATPATSLLKLFPGSVENVG